MHYRIELRTRMSASLGHRATSKSHVIDSKRVPATPHVAEMLKREVDDPVLQIESINYVGDRPFSLSTRWFDIERYPDLTDYLHRTGSITKSLKELGIDDYLRSQTTISARHATPNESELLEFDNGSIVLVAEALDVYVDGQPLQHLITRFAAQRVQLSVDNPT